MRTATGLVYRDGAFVEGSAQSTAGKVKLGNSPDESAEITGWIIPKTVNCHTHLGDGFISKPEKCSIEELVAPPNGLKHRLLRTVDEQRQVSCMREMISLMARTGTSHFIDFRESGLEGTRRLLMASLGCEIVPVILGRPETCDTNEISSILSVADGIGMSSISDVEYDCLAKISEHALATEKAFAMHASEVKREDMEMILALNPNMLVHMIRAEGRDMGLCASSGTPVAICPSSNSYFGIKPPLRNMLDAGITVCLGSDNAMLAEPNMLNEMRVFRNMFPESILSDEEILELAFNNGRKVLNSLPGLGDANMSQPDFFVLEAPVDGTFMSVLKHGAGKVHMFETGGIQ